MHGFFDLFEWDIPFEGYVLIQSQPAPSWVSKKSSSFSDETVSK